MKKILAILLAMMLMMSCAAMAQETTEPVNEDEAAAAWYELSAEDTVLTVRLPGNTKTGLIWNFEISNPEVLELITQETIEGESEGMAGAPTTYVASFMSTAGAENTLALILTCKDEAQPEEAPVYTRVLQLAVTAENKIIVESVEVREPFADWCEFGDEGYILTVRMPDAAWNFEIVDPEMLELINCGESEGPFVASFMATMEKAGFTEIIFTSDDELEVRSVDVFINESGEIMVQWVDVFDILVPAEPVEAE